MKLVKLDSETGWATIEHEGVDYVVLTTDFQSAEDMKAFILAQADSMQPDPIPSFIPKVGGDL